MSIFPNPSPPSHSPQPPAPPAPPPSAPPPPGAPPPYHASTAIRASAILSAASASARRRKLEGSGSVCRGHCADRRQCLSVHAAGQSEEGSYGKRDATSRGSTSWRKLSSLKTRSKPENRGRTSRPTGAGAPASESGCRTGQGRGAQESGRDAGSTRRPRSKKRQKQLRPTFPKCANPRIPLIQRSRKWARR